MGVENTRALAAEALKAPLASPTFTGTPAAPTAAAGTNTTQLASTAFVVANAGNGNVGRNLLHNGELTVNQRGTTASTNGAYSADRWILELSTTTGSVSTAALIDAERTTIGDEAAVQYLSCPCSGSAGAGDFFLVAQRMEGTQRYGGKSITVSFWALGTVGPPSIGVGLVQNFGSGGSPSAAVTVNATKVQLTTGWARYTVTLAVPTTIGKTIGSTAGTDYTEIRFWLSSGATNNTLAGGIGVQTFTFKLWGVQAEIGAVATAFEKKSIVQHTLDCQRFFRPSTVYTIVQATTGNPVALATTFPDMRAIPSATVTSTAGSSGLTTFTAGGLTVNSAFAQGIASTTGAVGLEVLLALSADL